MTSRASIPFLLLCALSEKSVNRRQIVDITNREQCQVCTHNKSIELNGTTENASGYDKLKQVEAGFGCRVFGEGTSACHSSGNRNPGKLSRLGPTGRALALRGVRLAASRRLGDARDRIAHHCDAYDATRMSDNPSLGSARRQSMRRGEGTWASTQADSGPTSTSKINPRSCRKLRGPDGGMNMGGELNSESGGREHAAMDPDSGKAGAREGAGRSDGSFVGDGGMVFGRLCFWQISANEFSGRGT
ncbi:hypothetical protein C8R47DRAFT_1242284 [Mycena vitilis]|nr:hypothetical protein C8R47DRAFT_1242284 [Mycena vitilis]